MRRNHLERSCPAGVTCWRHTACQREAEEAAARERQEADVTADIASICLEAESPTITDIVFDWDKARADADKLRAALSAQNQDLWNLDSQISAERKRNAGYRAPDPATGRKKEHDGPDLTKAREAHKLVRAHLRAIGFQTA